MNIFINNKELLKKLDLKNYLARFKPKVLFTENSDIEMFVSAIQSSNLEADLVIFKIPEHEVIDATDWVATHWNFLKENRIPIIGILMDEEGIKEIIVFTNARGPKVEHISEENLKKTIEIILTIHYEFLIDEFAEHDFPGLNDIVEKDGKKYNVQTQYYPGENSRISCEIYHEGRIIKTLTHHVDQEKFDKKKLKFLIEDLHTKVLSNIDGLVK